MFTEILGKGGRTLSVLAKLYLSVKSTLFSAKFTDEKQTLKQGHIHADLK